MILGITNQLPFWAVLFLKTECQHNSSLWILRTSIVHSSTALNSSSRDLLRKEWSVRKLILCGCPPFMSRGHINSCYLYFQARNIFQSGKTLIDHVFNTLSTAHLSFPYEETCFQGLNLLVSCTSYYFHVLDFSDLTWLRYLLEIIKNRMKEHEERWWEPKSGHRPYNAYAAVVCNSMQQLHSIYVNWVSSLTGNTWVKQSCTKECHCSLVSNHKISRFEREVSKCQ